jgi:hypothetical protein
MRQGVLSVQIQIQIKEHIKHIRPTQTDKLVVAEHSINHDHVINPYPAKVENMVSS